MSLIPKVFNWVKGVTSIGKHTRYKHIVYFTPETIYTQQTEYSRIYTYAQINTIYRHFAQLILFKHVSRTGGV